MGIKDIFKVNRKTFFNPSAWIGADSIKDSTSFMWDVLKGLFYPPAVGHQESFEHAMERLNLKEEDIEQTGQDYLLFALIFMFCGLFALIFSFYLLFHHVSISGFVIGISVSALFLTQAFRYHFWFFQIKHRKLGCTFQEWLQGSVNPPRQGS